MRRFTLVVDLDDTQDADVLRDLLAEAEARIARVHMSHAVIRLVEGVTPEE